MLLFGPSPPGCAAVTLVGHCQGDWELCIFLFLDFHRQSRCLSSFHFEFRSLAVSSFSLSPSLCLSLPLFYFIFVKCNTFLYLTLLQFSRNSCVISFSILLSFILYSCDIFLFAYSFSLSIVTRELTILQYLPHILVVCGYVNLLHHFPGFRMLHAKHFCVQALLYSALWKKNSSRLMAAVLSPLLFYCRFTLNPPGSYSPLYCLFPRASLCTLIYCYFSLSADQAPVALPGLPRASA